MSATRSKKPWPMKWIVLGIVVFIIPYTYLTLHYRKAAPPSNPYADTLERGRMAEAGYKRIAVALSRPADPPSSPASAAISAAAGGLPPPLRAALTDAPLLPSDIGSVAAPPAADHLQPYAIRFTCTQADNREEPGWAQLYVKDGDIFVVPECERLAGALLARTRENVIVVTVPAGSLAPGRYRATLVGRQASKSWTLQVH